MRLSHRPPFDLQGHRGARGLLPENTVESCLEAVRHGMHAIEFDVVLSGDDHVIVSHEPWMNPLFCSDPQGQPISEAHALEHNLHAMTLAEIRRYDCGRRGNPKFPQQRPMAAHKPTLAEVVTAVDALCDQHRVARRRFNVEIKSYAEWEGRFQPAPEVLAARIYREAVALELLGRATLQSFDARVVEALRVLDPEAELALLVENGDTLEANLAKLSFVPDLYAPYHGLIDAELVAAVHARGMLLVTWTVNDVDTMRRLHELGVDGIITDHPERAAALFDIAPIG